VADAASRSTTITSRLTRDGVTLIVPLLALNQVDAARCDWLVPGLAREKITRLAVAAAEARHQLGPLPGFVDVPCGEQTQDAPLAQAVARYAARVQSNDSARYFRHEMLPAHLR
jgi:ATP-dependent helicase HrpA